MNSFKTVSSPKKNLTVMAITFAVMAVAALFGFTVTAGLVVFLEAILLICFAAGFFITKRTYWIVEFRGEILIMYNNGNKQAYQIDELTRSDFILKQTEKQKAKNVGDVKFKNYPFLMYDVESFAELEAYINNNFK